MTRAKMDQFMKTQPDTFYKPSTLNDASSSADNKSLDLDERKQRSPMMIYGNATGKPPLPTTSSDGGTSTLKYFKKPKNSVAQISDGDFGTTVMSSINQDAMRLFTANSMAV